MTDRIQALRVLRNQVTTRNGYEDIRRLGIWAHAYEYFAAKNDQEGMKRATKKIQAFYKEYPWATSAAEAYVEACKDSFRFTASVGGFVDGTGREYVRWSLNTFGEVLDD